MENPKDQNNDEKNIIESGNDKLMIEDIQKKEKEKIIEVNNDKIRTINVGGHFGSTFVAIEMVCIKTIQDLINAVHEQTEFPKTYKMSGGAPPNRTIFQVPYDYKINGYKSKFFDKSASISSIIHEEYNSIAFDIIYIPRVD